MIARTIQVSYSVPQRQGRRPRQFFQSLEEQLGSGGQDRNRSCQSSQESESPAQRIRKPACEQTYACKQQERGHQGNPITAQAPQHRWLSFRHLPQEDPCRPYSLDGEQGRKQEKQGGNNADQKTLDHSAGCKLKVRGQVDQSLKIYGKQQLDPISQSDAKNASRHSRASCPGSGRFG